MNSDRETVSPIPVLKLGSLCEPGSVSSACDQVRRTKISERMRKLQDLVPNMDKVKFSSAFADAHEN